MCIFDEIKFNEKFHRYYLDGRTLQNVTSWVKTFTPPFARDEIAARVAERDGVEVADVLKEWEAKGKASREKGSAVHSYIRDRLEGVPFEDDPFLVEINDPFPEQLAFEKFWSKVERNMEAVYVEQVIGDRDWLIAGTVDALFWHKALEKHYLLDWKTGKFFFNSEYGETMRPPFDDLPNCQHVIYSLQLSLYRLILERNSDFQVENCYLCHLMEDGEFKVHKAIDLRGRVSILLKYQQKTNINLI